MNSLATIAGDSEVVDVGCGLSGTALALHESGRSVIAADYSLPALHAQAARMGRGTTVYLNLNDRHSVLDFALARIASGVGTSLVFEHVLEGLGGEGAKNSLLLMRWLLRGEDLAVVTVHTELPADHTFTDPTSWHLPADEFVRMAAEYGLTATVVQTDTGTDVLGRTRKTARLIVRHDGGEAS